MIRAAGILLLCLVGVSVAGSSPLRAARAEASSASGSSSMTLDPITLYVTAQAADGTPWAVSWREGDVGIERWEDGHWHRVESIVGWPQWVGIVEMVADPKNPGAVLSLWGTSNGPDIGRKRLQLRRHVAGAPARLLASFDDPTGEPSGKHSGLPARMTVDVNGDVWLTYAAPYLVRISGVGGEAQIREVSGLRPSWLAADKRHVNRSLAYTPEQSKCGWLWAMHDTWTDASVDALARPLWVADGVPSSDYVLNGLPDGRVVTLVARTHRDRTVWALENAGLWEVDGAVRKATPRSSPTGAWRIVDWCKFDDGTEVAVVLLEKPANDHLVSTIWIRENGVWRDAGPSGDTSVSLGKDSLPGLGLHGWAVWDGMLLGTGFNHGLIGVDLSGPGSEALRVRTPDWTDGLYVREVSRTLLLPGGNLGIQGSGGMVTAEPGSLKGGREAAEENKNPAAFAVNGVPLRAADGRLWFTRPNGRGEPSVNHWDGVRWHKWALPDEYTAETAYGDLWVDELGRVAVFSYDKDKPAWERDAAAPKGWRRWPTGWSLVENRASAPEKAKNLLPTRHRFLIQQPEIAADGRALMAFRRELRLWTKGKWETLTKGSEGWQWSRYGFTAEGKPWIAYNDARHVFEADGTMRPDGKDAVESDEQMKTGVWPDWLKKRLDYDHARSAHQDDQGVWWVLLDGELWKGWRGEVSQVFTAQEVTPFRVASRNGFLGVHADARGNRLFDGDFPVLVPASPAVTVKVTWLHGGEVADRVARLEGDGVTHFEWRLNGGPWRMQTTGILKLREVPNEPTVLEVRGYNRRLDAGPEIRDQVKADYDPDGRVRELIRRLYSTDYAVRTEAVERLALRGRPAVPMIQATLLKELDDTRRWWLRAALQAIADRPDKSLTTS